MVSAAQILSRATRHAMAMMAVVAVSTIYLSTHLLAKMALADEWVPSQHGIVGPLGRAIPAFALSSLTFTLPFLIAFAVLCELFGLRKFWTYVVAFIFGAALSLPVSVNEGGAQTVFILLVYATGLVAGLLYWFIAGRSAGLQTGKPRES